MTIQDILEELYEAGRTDEEYNPLDRENTISGGKDKVTAQAKIKLQEMFGEQNNELLVALKRLVERIDFNGGIGEYQGGPAFVMQSAREAIAKADMRQEIRNRVKGSK